MKYWYHHFIGKDCEVQKGETTYPRAHKISSSFFIFLRYVRGFIYIFMPLSQQPNNATSSAD